MTENDSPENLRKFLESDDSAMVMMGLSMAEGSGVHEEMLMEILRLYMLHSDKTIRAAAKSTFIKLAPEDFLTDYTAISQNISGLWYLEEGQDLQANDVIAMGLLMAKGMEVSDEMLVEILWMYLFHDEYMVRAAAKSTFIKLAPEDAKQAVKDNWKASYRNWYAPQHLGILGRALCHTSVSLVEPLIKVLKDVRFRRVAASALGEIGDVRAVEPLIKALKDDNVAESAASALGEIGDARAVEPIIKVLGNDPKQIRWTTRRTAAAEALGKIGDKRAGEPLIKMLNNKSQPTRMRVTNALLGIENVKGLKIALRDKNQFVRNTAKEALKKLGHEVDE